MPPFLLFFYMKWLNTFPFINSITPIRKIFNQCMTDGSNLTGLLLSDFYFFHIAPFAIYCFLTLFFIGTNSEIVCLSFFQFFDVYLGIRCLFLFDGTKFFVRCIL